MVMWETPRYIGVYNDQNKYGYWLNLNPVSYTHLFIRVSISWLI